MPGARTVQWRDDDVAPLLSLIDEARQGARRVLVGVAGPPGAGKTTLAGRLAADVGVSAVVVSMDGFHLADCVLDRLGRRDRKGAPDTFDAAGFVQLLRRIRDDLDEVVYAPVFVREQEQAVAGALPVERLHSVVIVEGNYLLCDGAFAPVRGLLDTRWYVDPDPVLRRDRLINRHVRYGRSPAAAQRWVERTDEPNARRVAFTRGRADVVVRPVAVAGTACAG
jgi:pantothenate kinase